MVGTFLRPPLPQHLGRLLILPLLLLLSLNLAQADEPAKSPAPSRSVKLTLPAALLKPSPESVADLKAIQGHVRGIIESVTPAVVCVQIGAGSGSGVIVSPDGYVLTAGHVSGDPGRAAILVMPDGRQRQGQVAGL